MGHGVTARNTKLALAGALKASMRRKPLAKITVSEIAARCGVNRKTFYYHFEDVYGLLKWTLEQEAFEVVKRLDLLADAEAAIRFVIGYVGRNRHVVDAAYDAMGMEGVKRFFHADFMGVMRPAIDGVEREMGLSVDEAFKSFLADFYTGALVCALADWRRAFAAPRRAAPAPPRQPPQGPSAPPPPAWGPAQEQALAFALLTFRASLPSILQARARQRADGAARRAAGPNRGVD
jgi:AcrR family transcriptional regulator